MLRKSVELESKSSSSKVSFLAYIWSKETVEGDTLTTILSNDEDQVVQSLPTHRVYTWNNTAFSLVVTEILIIETNVVFDNVTCWKRWRGKQVAAILTRRNRGRNWCMQLPCLARPNPQNDSAADKEGIARGKNKNKWRENKNDQ